MGDHGNGVVLVKKKKKKQNRIEAEVGRNSSGRREADGNDGYEDSDYSTHISEEHYRAMLGEHIQKYRRVKFKDNSSRSASSSVPMGLPVAKRIAGSKGRKMGSEERGMRGMDNSADYLREISPLKPANYYDAGFGTDYGADKLSSSFDCTYLGIGEGISYRIPPSYDKLATSLMLPSFLEIQVDEYYLKGTLDMGSLSMMTASNIRSGSRKRSAMSEPQPQHDSLQARLKALSASNSVQKFSLQVCDIGLDSSSIPEGAAGGIRRSIMSEAGILQIYYVKVLEKGDTYEIIERSLPKKQNMKKDPASIEKEEMDRIGKVKLKISRSVKLMRGAAIRTRKLARDMLVFWKRIDKEQAEVRKREEREAAEALKREQEAREARRHEQRLNFLISQTELYSHFMQNKFSSQTSETLTVGEGEPENDGDLPIGDGVPEEEEDSEEVQLKKEALMAAQLAVSQQKRITSAFDSECMKLRQVSEPEEVPKEATIAGSSNIDLLNPSTMPVTSSVGTPSLFKGHLKEYQLKGLQWLVNCYEQGLNGILADEMGLGKTIQAMAFLAHLAEEKNIWGPFLVVAPASVLNNWADEISRFCPDLKTLPYWGGLQERTILRKNINPKRLYRRDAGFHILITSYQLLVSDEKYFRRVKWQYMVLDEAQAIKSSNSIRWKTLLSFNCRNRLLLTGTPIQNNMAELWALLHFIMPTLFDSHEQFNEWFSKGIENHAEHGGTLNEHQLNRLHAVLKPFMLRRVKKDVITEMTGKTEITVHCKLSSRQQAFYQAIKNKISLTELFDGSRGHLNEKKIMNLMNIVIQLRKVCNHPELFERNEGSTYLYFGDMPNSLLPPPFGELEDVYYSGARNPINLKIPKLIYEDIVQASVVNCSTFGRGIQKGLFEKLFNVFSPKNIHSSGIPQSDSHDESPVSSGAFGFARLMDLSAEEASFLSTGSFMERLLFSIITWNRQSLEESWDFLMESEDNDLQCDQIERWKIRAVTRMLLKPSRSESNFLRRKSMYCHGYPPLEPLIVSMQDRLINNISLLQSTYAFIPRTRAPPIDALCSDRDFTFKMLEEQHHPWLKRLFVGFARISDHTGPRQPKGGLHPLIQEIDSELPLAQPALQLTYKIFGSSPPVQSFDPAKMLTDSGKLQTLDILLKRLRAGNHRVLLFAQMTKMLNILEDYMNYRKYRYLRLDGSSTIMDRRDMVRDFQHRSDIFVFLLSTRAGGLGINLTAADTVIFYESDWNPTLDLQAMDRAHRLGQTKEVTVYRLICKETVEEKILQRASQKNTVQQLVMTGGHVQGDDLLAPEDVVSLLIDDAQLEQKLREAPLQGKDRQKKKRGTKGIRLDAEGEASLEDLTNGGPASIPNGSGQEVTPDQGIANKKRKAGVDKQNSSKPRSSQKVPKNADLGKEMDEMASLENELEDPYREIDPQHQKLKRPKRPKKSINENFEPVSTITTIPASEPTDIGVSNGSDPANFREERGEDISLHDHSPMS
ncbi:hypothetical protein Scep_014012 [Stephania cephalantha]|uniref:Chromatin-remodeling ATPase INO80 n=1 Tax=Stephania cephalantha TaxID=152367 RepID=A0AAP0J0F7_9MAGN